MSDGGTRHREENLHRIEQAAGTEPFARTLGLRCTGVGAGYAKVEMTLTEEHTNLFGTGHGGAVFSLLDDAFQIACNSHGKSAFALNVSVTYVRPTNPGDHLIAEARELVLTQRTGTYELTVRNQAGETVAVAQALAFRKNDPVPF